MSGGKTSIATGHIDYYRLLLNESETENITFPSTVLVKFQRSQSQILNI